MLNLHQGTFITVYNILELLETLELSPISLIGKRFLLLFSTTCGFEWRNFFDFHCVYKMNSGLVRFGFQFHRVYQVLKILRLDRGWVGCRKNLDPFISSSGVKVVVQKCWRNKNQSKWVGWVNVVTNRKSWRIDFVFSVNSSFIWNIFHFL